MKTKLLFTIIAILFLIAVPLAYSFDDWDDGSPDDWDDGSPDDWDDDSWDDWDEGSPDDWDDGSPDDWDDGSPDDWDDGEEDIPDEGEDDDWPPDDEWEGEDDNPPDGVWPEPELHVASISGKSQLNVGEEQTLGIVVKDLDNNSVNGVIVTAYYTTGHVFGVCVTTDNGGCSISQEMNTPGTYSVFATAFKNGYVPDADDYPLLTFEVINNAPYFTSTPVTTAYTGEDYYYDADAVDDDGDDISYTLIESPEGMMINTATGEVEWLGVDITDLGEHNITIRATDEHGLYAEQSYVLNVIDWDNNAPYFVSTPITVASKDEEYRYDADAIDPNGDDISYSLIDGPEGMEINEDNGLVTWTPKASGGNFHATIRVTDEHGLYSEQDWPIMIRPADVSFRLGDLVITKLRIASDEYLSPGNELILSVNLENDGEKNLDDIKVTASVLELSARKSTGHFTLKKHDEKTRTLFVELPQNAEAGEYGLRVEVHNGDLKRIVYRDFFIVD